jgi:two-component system response regulator AlgR
VKILVVDDEQLARQRLQRLIEGTNGYSVCGEAATGRAAIEQTDRLQPDVVLLDIRMPDMDGLEAARHLSRLGCPPAIIFTTAFADHALSAFETNPVSYLLKPIRKEHLEAALGQSGRITRAQMTSLDAAHKTEARRHLCVKVRGDLHLVPVAEIRFFRAEQKYVTVRTTEAEFLIEESLKSLEDEFGERFVRVHRNLLVAAEYITGMDRLASGGWGVRLQDIDETLDVSRRHLSALRERLAYA